LYQERAEKGIWLSVSAAASSASSDIVEVRIFFVGIEIGGLVVHAMVLC
jgi:hypothetical protein